MDYMVKESNKLLMIVRFLQIKKKAKRFLMNQRKFKKIIKTRISMKKRRKC